MSLAVRFGHTPLSTRSRSTLLSELQHTYYIWDVFVSGQPRIALHPLILSEAAHRSAVCAAEATAQALYRVGERALVEPDLERSFCLHSDVRRLARASYESGDTLGLGRVDLLLGKDGGFHACEYNADCPGGHNESEALPRLAFAHGLSRANPQAVHAGAKGRHLRDPSHVVSSLSDALVAAAGAMSPGAPPTIGLTYATAYAEDLQVCAFLEKRLRARRARTLRLSASHLHNQKDGTLMANETPVHALYRYLPTEYLADSPAAIPLERAVRAGRLKTLSNFSHIYAQSKQAMAFAREHDAPIAETHSFAEVAVTDLERNRGDWVIKRSLGRVGDEVFVGSLHTQQSWAEVVSQVLRLVASGEAWIVQRFIPQERVYAPHDLLDWPSPDTQAGTERAPLPQLVTLGVYVLNGKFAGYFARVSPESHASHDAVVVPVLVESSS